MTNANRPVLEKRLCALVYGGLILLAVTTVAIVVVLQTQLAQRTSLGDEGMAFALA